MQIIAHRGIHDRDIEENSEKAIVSVLASVADGIEIDARLCSDNVCVVYHDHQAKDGSPINELSSGDLFEKEKTVIRLSKAISLLEKYQGLVNVEVKHLFGEKGSSRGKDCIEHLAVLLDGTDTSNYVLSTFSLKNLKELKNTLPNVPRALLAPRFIPLVLSYHYAKKYECEALHISLSQSHSPLISKIIKKLHDSNMKIRVYTVNDLDAARKLQKLKIDGVFTDKVLELSSGR